MMPPPDDCVLEKFYSSASHGDGFSGGLPTDLTRVTAGICGLAVSNGHSAHRFNIPRA